MLVKIDDCLFVNADHVLAVQSMMGDCSDNPVTIITLRGGLRVETETNIETVIYTLG